MHSKISLFKKQKRRVNMGKPTWKEHFQYWFDNRMSKGTGSMVRMLAVATTAIIIFLSCLVSVFALRDDGNLFATVWDMFASTINAWMPYSEDGEIGYLILTAIGAAVGLLFTSALIGIISSAIEEKLSSLRKGNSIVLEKEHIVILGFTPGEYSLIAQLVLAQSEKRSCLVIVDNMERDEMEQLIQENIPVPKNVRIVCRNANICDPNSLQVCQIPACKAVVINMVKDARTIKALLAVRTILDQYGIDQKNIPVISTVTQSESLLPPHTLKQDSIIMLQANDLISRIIAHSCTQPGLSEAFLDIFNFEDSELYLQTLPEGQGLAFGELVSRIDGGVPLGIYHNGSVWLNPAPNARLARDDKLLVFAPHENAIHLTKPTVDKLPLVQNVLSPIENHSHVVVIGCNKSLTALLHELPESITGVVIAGVTDKDRETIESLYASSTRRLSIFPGNLFDINVLESLVIRADHVVLLSDYNLTPEDADLNSIQLILKLRDIKQRLKLSYTVTAEMRRESNRNLVAAGDPTDFIVASNIVSMILAQLAVNPLLHDIFEELLSNEGNELYLKPTACFNCTEKEYSIRDLRLKTLSHGYLLLGYLKVRGNSRAVLLNPPLEETVVFSPEDSLVVLGNQ